ncbi:MAG: hypothetical protein GXP56_16655 [Deltaproteobacteria bacterium]|nr:hypothetical protein [Deltaproteobacteria bacterium]
MNYISTDLPANVALRLKRVLLSAISNALKKLLENKHLYQSIDIGFYEEMKKQINSPYLGNIRTTFEKDCLWNE